MVNERQRLVVFCCPARFTGQMFLPSSLKISSRPWIEDAGFQAKHIKPAAICAPPRLVHEQVTSGIRMVLRRAHCVRLLRAIRRAASTFESRRMYLELPAAGHEQAAVRRRVEWLRRQGSNL